MLLHRWMGVMLAVVAIGCEAAVGTVPTTEPGLRGAWSWGVSHATKLGHVDWAKSDQSTIVDQINWELTHDLFIDGGSSQYFALKLTGLVEVPEDGAWTFTVGSDEAARLWIDGQLVVNDGSPHSFRWREGTIVLDAGSHEIEVHFLERSWTAGLIVEWHGPGVDQEVIPASALSHLVDEDPPSSTGGLRAFWTSGVSHASTLGQIDWYKYDSTTVEDNVSWKLTHGAFYLNGPDEYFSTRLIGQIEVPDSGTWSFELGSDEAAGLWIDGQIVTYDGSPHSYRWSSGSVSLSAGSHAIEVRYLERSWTAGLHLAWQGPSDEYVSIVPQSALTPGSVDDLGSSGDGGLRAYWQSGVSHATNLGQVDWDIYDHSSVVSRISWKLTHGAFYPNGPDEYFAVRLVGTIDIPESGYWTFKLGSDEAAGLWIDGQAVAYDPSPHSYRWKTGTKSLAAGPHQFEVRFLERSWTAGLETTWQGPGDDFESVIPASAFTPGTIDPPGASSEQGLRAYWTSDVSHAEKLGQIDWNAYTHTTIEDRINWSLTHGAFYDDGPTEYFAARFVGRITIPATGDWTFSLGADEAARMWIDGELLTNDGSPHSFRWKSATVHLTAGQHDFEVRYLERSWTAGLVATWSGPSIPNEEVIPTEAFSPMTFDMDQGEGLRAFWTSGVSHATNLGQIDWYDHTHTTTGHNVAWRLTHGAFYDGGPTQYFAGRLIGTINIPETGAWSFELGADEAAALWIDGELLTYDGSPHSFRWRTGSVTLDAGPHDIEIRYLERSWTAGLFLTWRGPSDPYVKVVPASALTPASVDDIGDDGDGGLTAYWSSGVSHASALGQVDWNQYDHTTTEDNLSWRLTHGAFYLNGPTQYFGVRFIGTITIPEGGQWTFNLGSDEAAEMYIDGELLIYDDQPHSYRWRNGSVLLSQGDHDIDIRFFERSWTAGLFLTWQGPSDTYESVVPAGAFTPGTIPTFAGGGVRAQWYNSGGAHSLDGVSWTNPIASTTHDNISWKLTHGAFYPDGPTQYFAGNITAKIEIPEDGQWTFWLGSDEAGELLIDGVVIASDPSTHSFHWKTGTVSLTQGIHTFQVRYLEKSWTAGLVVAWKGPSDAHENVIPPDAFPPASSGVRLVQWREVGQDD